MATDIIGFQVVYLLLNYVLFYGVLRWQGLLELVIGAANGFMSRPG
jgi:hypothetical protein